MKFLRKFSSSSNIIDIDFDDTAHSFTASESAAKFHKFTCDFSKISSVFFIIFFKIVCRFQKFYKLYSNFCENFSNFQILLKFKSVKFYNFKKL